MTKGIYGYYDNVKNKVVYIGQSKNLKDRLFHHMKPSKYDEQQINKIIQNNPDRYEPFILADGNFTTDELNELEYEAVEIFKTNRYKYPENEGFNFKDGGDVKDFSKETKLKISKALKGKPKSDEHKKKVSENHADFSGENNPMYGRTGENCPSWKNYPRIVKKGIVREKQNYAIRFNGKIIKQSVSLNKLKKWFKENYPNEELIIE